MTRGSWARTARRSGPAVAPDAWPLAVERARQAFADLHNAGYSDAAAAIILEVALRLLPATAAIVASDGPETGPERP